jgi:hypothetical protein
VFKRDKLFTPRRASDSAIVFQIAAIPKTNEAVRRYRESRKCSLKPHRPANNHMHAADRSAGADMECARLEGPAPPRGSGAHRSNASRAAVSASLDAISKADAAMSRLVIAAGLKLIVVPIDST